MKHKIALELELNWLNRRTRDVNVHRIESEKKTAIENYEHSKQ